MRSPPAPLRSSPSPAWSGTRAHSAAGFTLTELAIALVIVGLLTGGLLLSLTTTRDIANEKETQKQLTMIQEALLGFAVAQQRLPCPTAPNAAGIESPAGGGVCTNPYDGFLPGNTLGLAPTDAQGYVIDAWGNRIRYAVTTVSATSPNLFTTVSGLKSQWSAGPQPDLRVCNTAAGITNAGTANADCAANASLTDSAVAIIFSTGHTGASGPLGADEQANVTTIDRVFVSTSPSPNFDDLVTWLSPNILYNRMIAAGRLP